MGTMVDLMERHFVDYRATPSLGGLPLSPPNLMVLRTATGHGVLFSWARELLRGFPDFFIFMEKADQRE